MLGAACLALIVRVLRERASRPCRCSPQCRQRPSRLLRPCRFSGRAISRPGTTTLAFFLLPFTALVAVVARAPFPPWLPRVLAIIAVAQATLFAVIGIWQALTHELLFFAPNLEVANTYAPIFRVTSLFRDPSLYGRHVVLGIVVIVVAVWLPPHPDLPAVALIALLWTGLYYSYSQSSLAALFVAVLAISAIAGSRGVRKAIAATTAALLLVGTALVVNEALDTSVRRATSDRSRRVELTARVFAEHPIAGVGIGSQPLASQQLSERSGPKPNFVSHATPVTVAAELGVIGLLAYVALLVGRRLPGRSRATARPRAWADARAHASGQPPELRDQFIAVLGHDLRNPLAAVSSGTRLLLSREPDEFSVQIIGMMQASVPADERAHRERAGLRAGPARRRHRPRAAGGSFSL